MINQEEYEVLKELDDKWKWIARDGVKNKLNVYELRPIKSAFVEWWFTNKWYGYSKIVPIDLFQFVQWEDEEPHSIAELIEEYEKKKYRFRLGNLEMSDFVDNSSGKSYTVFSLVVEGDEEMKKDKDWLSEQIGDLNSTDAVFNESGETYIARAVRIERVYNLINQLDEPAKVVVPQFVADWIEHCRNSFNSMSYLMSYVQIKRFNHELTLWCYESGSNDNLHTLARAWLDGYEVEKEQKYYVMDSEDIPLLERVNNRTFKTTTALSIYEACRDNSKFALTEQEIKDYDERFWAFAVPVEEQPND